MDLEIVIMNEVRQRRRNPLYDIPYMQNLKRNDTNEFIYKTETDSQTLELKLWLPGGRDIQGVWNGHVYTAIFKMNNQQGPTVQHVGILLNVMWQ